MDVSVSTLSSSDGSSYPSDVVNYTGSPSAPLIIPVVFFSVVIIAIILAIIKLLERFWTRHRKSDTYVFVEPNEDDSRTQIHYEVDNKSDGKLIPLTYLTVRRTTSNGNLGAVNHIYDDPNGDDHHNRSHMRVEANVHQSHLIGDNPLRNATESDV